MPRFFTGDELGAIKTVSYVPAGNKEGWQSVAGTLLEGSSSGSRAQAIQKLALHANGNDNSKQLVAAGRADGSAAVFSFDADGGGKLDERFNWQETRLKQDQKYVGLSLAPRGVYSCTSNGALRLTKFDGENENVSDSQLGVLPTRLTEWRLSPDEKTLAYTGHEVELSVWDTERAFSSNRLEGSQTSKDSDDAEGGSSKKRKRTEQLLPGELWRAKNLPNDSLNLRQPVRNTAFTYLQPSSSSSQRHLIIGTQFGDVRRYDTRAARRPVSNWKGIGKTGGIGVIENGLTEHQVFVSDRGSSLYALDLRNGKVSFGYKGFSGAVTSIAPCTSFLASAAEDRFVRLHSTFPPPAQVGQQQERKGEVLEKTYVKVVPTVVVWDAVCHDSQTSSAEMDRDEEDGENDDDMWNEMEDAESEDEHLVGRKKSKAK